MGKGNEKKKIQAPSAPPYVWPVAIDPWQLSGPGGQGEGGGGARTRTEETPPPPWRKWICQHLTQSVGTSCVCCSSFMAWDQCTEPSAVSKWWEGT